MTQQAQHPAPATDSHRSADPEARVCTGRRAILVGEIPERPKGTDCKSVGTAFPGSNPGLATISRKRSRVERPSERADPRVVRPVLSSPSGASAIRCERGASLEHGRV